MIIIIFRFHAVFGCWFFRTFFGGPLWIGLVIFSVKNILQWEGPRWCIADVRWLSANGVVSAVPDDPYEDWSDCSLFAAGWGRWTGREARLGSRRAAWFEAWAATG